MDIVAALADMHDYIALGDYAEAIDCAINIRRWVCNGGFVPAGYTKRAVIAECNGVLHLAG